MKFKLVVLAVLAAVAGGGLWWLTPPTPSPAEVRATTLAKTADDATRAAAAKRLKALDEFFADAQSRAPAFAAEATSFDGGWLLVKDQLGLGRRGEHVDFLKAAFEKKVFTPADLDQAIRQTTDGFRADLRAIDDRFLIDLRADLADDPTVPPDLALAARSDEAFRAAYRRTLEAAMPALVQDVAGSAVVEVATLYLGNIAGKYLVALGTQIGVAGNGFWGTAVAGGLTIVAGLVVDALIQWVLEQFGYNPTDRVAVETRRSLGAVRAKLVDGDPAAVAEYQAAKSAFENTWWDSTRAAERAKCDALGASGRLGLAKQFEVLADAQAALRRKATESLVRKP